MSLTKHSRFEKYAFRAEREDALKKLTKLYPELEEINGNNKLGTLREELDVIALSQALKARSDG